MKTSTILIVGAVVVIIAIASVAAYWFMFLAEPGPRKLYVQVQPGQTAVVEQYIVPLMLEKHDCEVVVAEAISNEALSKVMAAPDDPPYDVIRVDAYPFVQGKNADLWATLNQSEAPNINEIPTWLQDADMKGIGMSWYTMGIGYMPELLEANGIPPPDSWWDLWDPALNGKATIQSISSTWSVFFMIEIACALADDPEAYANETLMMAGLEKIKELRDIGNIGVFHGASSEMLALMEAGEVWAGHQAAYRIVGGLVEKGVNASWVPCETGLLGFTYTCITEGSNNKDMAHKFINYLLDAEFLAEWHRKTRQAVGNEKALAYLTPNELESYDIMYPEGIDEILISPDWEYVAEHQPDWTEWWNANIEI
ncbi:MAG: extracellular solute-binding protein [Candidatus Bathyarchaeota archaeon]|nr:MAG: extracellular solute-binding protein [Candidatus Bathyarchaeota archaeon]